MSYSFYHILHIFCVVALVSSITLSLKGDSTKKSTKIATGISSLLLLVSGMGLLARIGSDFEPWVIGKLSIWLALGIIIPVTTKRFPEKKCLVFKIAMALLFVAIYLVSTK